MDFQKGDIVAVKQCQTSSNGLMTCNWAAAIYDHRNADATHSVLFLPSTSDYLTREKTLTVVQNVDILPAFTKWPWLRWHRIIET